MCSPLALRPEPGRVAAARNEKEPMHMTRWMPGLLAPLALCGCIFTETPVYDDTNSDAAAESAALVAFLEVARGYDWYDAAPEVPVPVWAQITGNPTAFRVGPEVAGYLILQEQAETCELTHCVVYYAVRIAPGGTPQVCLANTRATGAMQALAQGEVSLVDASGGDPSKLDLPPDIGVEGPPEAQRAFLERVFGTGLVTCESGREKTR